ncbi:MAG: hypothetical protein ACK55Z_24400, partial [bacterium]
MLLSQGLFHNDFDGVDLARILFARLDNFAISALAYQVEQLEVFHPHLVFVHPQHVLNVVHPLQQHVVARCLQKVVSALMVEDSEG